MNDFVICIPARYDSTRLPGKPLIKIQGKELVLWAVDSARQLKTDNITVATDDQRIYDVVKNYNCDVVMTLANHSTGTDRLSEVAKIKSWSDDTIVVNYQGDEPQTPKQNIEQLVNMLDSNPRADIATLYQSITNFEDLINPNNVKLVTDTNDFALYFSRSAIPFSRSTFEKQKLDSNIEYKHHIGLYAYRTRFLNKFSQLKSTHLEKTESLEQLRALENGYKILSLIHI